MIDKCGLSEQGQIPRAGTLTLGTLTKSDDSNSQLSVPASLKMAVVWSEIDVTFCCNIMGH